VYAAKSTGGASYFSIPPIFWPKLRLIESGDALAAQAAAITHRISAPKVLIAQKQRDRSLVFRAPHKRAAIAASRPRIALMMSPKRRRNNIAEPAFNSGVRSEKHARRLFSIRFG
jgi:hypothetical protein